MGVYDVDRDGAERMINLLINHTRKVSKDLPAMYIRHRIYFYAGVPTEVFRYKSGIETYFCIN